MVNPLTKGDLKVVQKVNGVEIAAGRMIETSVVEVDKKSYVSYIASIPIKEDERRLIEEVGNINIEQGRMLRSIDKYKIIVGSDFHNKEKLGKNLNLGDVITIQGIDFEIVGINVREGAFTVDGVIIMNEDVLRELYSNSETYSVIVAKATDMNQIDVISERIQKDLRKFRDEKVGKEDFQVQTNDQALQSINQMLDIVTMFLAGIAAISLVVGGIGIMNTMYTSVLERKSDIGIMKAIGARNKDIFVLFFVESGFLGLAGGIIGIIIGVGIGKLVELIGRLALGTSLLSAAFSTDLIIGALLFSFIVGAAAGTLPAMGAAKLNPVDALRD
ncbi:ABC transporter permease [Candidatus Woesearchaeota archaeon CG10_big_fil_rev_8_21_14_0_10_32_9]|nr:MAG: ABC transporter permease [Candidatus Woesearchaeota archaeon CG10_big_fil_rev_8_21_14_0_10_32_9]